MNWKQLQAILWLRWRLTQNHFINAASLNRVIFGIVVVFLAFLALGSGIGGLIGGVAAGRMATPKILLLICDGGIAVFLLVWLIGLMAELQRSESIDLGKLMHLPLSLRQVFLFNYAASHLTPSLLIFVPAFASFCAGLVFGAGLRMILLAAVVVGFLLMVTSWTYCLRGWLSSLMANRRRARAIAVWVTIGIVGVAQLPNLVVQSSAFRQKRSKSSATDQRKGSLPPAVLQAHILLPPGWVGYSAMTLKEGRYLPALGAALGSMMLAIAGILRAETLTRRYYSAAPSTRPERPREKNRENTGPGRGHTSRLLVERRLPFLNDDTAGLALATFRSLWRAPEMKMALLMPLIVFVVVAGPMIARVRGAPDMDMVFIPFMLSGIVVIISFLIAPTMGNVFGLDRGGFRALVLSPMPRRQILFARNLAFFPIVMVLNIIVIAGFAVFLHAPASVLLMGVLVAIAGFVLFAALCNYLAILAPYRYSMNSLKAKKFNGITLLSALASMLTAPIIVVPLMMPALLQFGWTRLGWPAWVPLDTIAALALLGFACWLYRTLLPHQGRLLQRRELRILCEVTTETE